MSTPSHRVTFTGSNGQQLAGRLDLPATPPTAMALFAHCFTCSKDLFAAGRIAAELMAAGIGVLRFDFAGLGASEGDFEQTDFSSNQSDLLAAADWLRANHSAPQLLIGHSLGGAAVISVAGSIPEVRAVATIAAPADAAHVTTLFTDELPAIAAEGCRYVQIGDRTFPIRQAFVDDLLRHSVEERVATMRAPLLVMHSPIDNTVGVENAARLFTAARHPKSFVSLDGADHLLSRREDAVFAAQIIATWAQRYLVAEHAPLPVPAATAPVVVAETGLGTFLNHVVAGDHRWLADEPVDVGGFDAGPSPYDMLAAALGACTSMTMRMYAQRKQLALRRVTVEVRHQKRHADDCADCVDGKGALTDHFDRHLVIEGELSDADRQSLVKIADRCPVHRTLEAGSRIVTTVG